jgi:hypothetical protein
VHCEANTGTKLNGLEQRERERESFSRQVLWERDSLTYIQRNSCKCPDARKSALGKRKSSQLSLIAIFAGFFMCWFFLIFFTRGYGAMDWIWIFLIILLHNSLQVMIHNLMKIYFIFLFCAYSNGKYWMTLCASWVEFNWNFQDLFEEIICKLVCK